MQFFKGFEEWGRARAMGALARGMSTLNANARDVGEILRANVSARILLIGLYQKMGQFLCATPLIRAIKTAWPTGSLQFLGNPVNAVAARANPHLDRVWVWNKSALWEWPGQANALKKQGFDLALLLTTDRPSATGILMARATRARWTAAYGASIDGAWAHDAASLCHIRIPFGGEKNEVEKYLGFARAFGVPLQGEQPEFVPSPGEQTAAESDWTALKLAPNGPRVGLFIGGKSGRADRLWPTSHFARLADALKNAGSQVVALCPPPPAGSADTYVSDEHRRLETFRKELSWECPVYQQPALGRVAAFLKKLDLLVCPDGGIFHLAAAVGTPALGLFFSTDPDVWGHGAAQTILDGRGKPSSDLRPETVACEVARLLGAAAQP